jgi:hypothetical protein
MRRQVDHGKMVKCCSIMNVQMTRADLIGEIARGKRASDFSRTVFEQTGDVEVARRRKY